MEKYLTDEQNDEEIKNFLKGEKKFRPKFYGELLNSQFEADQRKNKDRYGTNDVLIINNKKKNNLYDNLFSYNKRYDFGKSNLVHNPIIRPENDITYNKYINLRLRKNIFKDINNNNKNNNIERENENYLNNIKIKDINIDNNLDLKRRNFRNKLYQSESNLLRMNENNKNNYQKELNNKKNLKSYSSLSNDNIFNSNNILNMKNNINPNRKLFEPENNYQNINNNILSVESNPNFYI